MDMTAPFKTEVLRPIITLVAPGIIACGPFALILGHYVPAVKEFWTVHPNAFAVLLGLVVLAVGFVIEDIGSFVESHVWDSILAKRNPAHLKDWKRYLKLQLNDELVGQRYLRTKLVQLKFELAMSPALLVFWIGLMWLNGIHQFWACVATILVSLTVFVGVAYLLYESWKTAGVLSETRAFIPEAVDEGVKGIDRHQRPGQ